ncbi:hypothetical protein ACJMK2_026372 [Sinanodonta woodiana]|uniref:E3 ubiquitin-protein ligase n=1 Tax=Sinanodonta woodiana TaxID=1069815 RepID=A0ABD3XJD4_SINWO
MAEDGSDVNEKKFTKELKQTFLICCVCSEVFDDESRHPRLLPCLHSICFTCLHNVVKDETVQCPICNDITSVPGGDLSKIRKDNTRRDLLDFVNVRTMSSEIKCSQCETDVAVSRCAECKDFLCKQCAHAHNVTKVTKSHPVSTIEELKSTSLTNFCGKSKCQKSGHDQYTVDLYCYKEGCRRPICTLCALTEHKEADGHIIKDGTSTYEQEKRETDTFLAQMKEREKEVDKITNWVKYEILKVHERSMQLEENIKTAFSNCRELLDKRENELILQIKQHCEDKAKVLNQQKARLEEFKMEIKDSISFTDGVLTGYSKAGFLQVHGQINKRHENLYARRFDQCPHRTANMTFNAVNMGTDFQKHVLTLGIVDSVDIDPEHSKIETFTGQVCQPSKVIRVSLFDRERRPFLEEKADVQVRILDTSNHPLTPFYNAVHSDSDNCFFHELTRDEPGVLVADVYVCGLEIRKKIKFAIKDSKLPPVGVKKGARAKDTGRSKTIKPQNTSPASKMNEKVVTGNQPRGSMDVRIEKHLSLPGNEGCGTIVITYTFQSGIQTENHPNPKKPYTGTTRIAYLPDNDKGQKVLKLLKVAFERGLLFAVGVSQTTGVDNCIVWNGVQHKTSRHGGHLSFGYPDPDYLDTVLDQLAAKGVTEVDL